MARKRKMKPLKQRPQRSYVLEGLFDDYIRLSKRTWWLKHRRYDGRTPNWNHCMDGHRIRNFGNGSLLTEEIYWDQLRYKPTAIHPTRRGIWCDEDTSSKTPTTTEGWQEWMEDYVDEGGELQSFPDVRQRILENHPKYTEADLA